MMAGIKRQHGGSTLSKKRLYWANRMVRLVIDLSRPVGMQEVINAFNGRKFMQKKQKKTPSQLQGISIKPNVQSSCILRIEFDNRVLPIWFKNLSCYDYQNVSNEVYLDFIRAKSKGQFFNSHIRQKYLRQANFNRKPNSK